MNPPAPRALIAEDEPLLAAALRQELARAWPALEVVATVGDGLSAVQQALALRPDVLFFDIRMPGQTGLDAAVELADAWPSDAPFPALVFATAYDQYAVQAFDAQAVDYLLKPIEARRLARTVAKVQELLAQRQPVPAPAAASRPLWPGMRMSKNSTSGCSVSAWVTADAPSPTVAQTCSAGQTVASSACSARASRGSSSAIRAVGAAGFISAREK